MSVEDKKISGWAIWYVDEMYSSQDTRFEDLPRDGALCLVTFETRLKPDGNHIKNIYQGYDYYFRADRQRDFLYGYSFIPRVAN